MVPVPSELIACCGSRPGLWFPQICWDVPVSEPMLHQQFVAGSAWLERFLHCLSFLGWL